MVFLCLYMQLYSMDHIQLLSGDHSRVLNIILISISLSFEFASLI